MLTEDTIDDEQLQLVGALFDEEQPGLPDELCALRDAGLAYRHPAKPPLPARPRARTLPLLASALAAGLLLAVLVTRGGAPADMPGSSGKARPVAASPADAPEPAIALPDPFDNSDIHALRRRLGALRPPPNPHHALSFSWRPAPADGHRPGRRIHIDTTLAAFH